MQCLQRLLIVEAANLTIQSVGGLTEGGAQQRTHLLEEVVDRRVMIRQQLGELGQNGVQSGTIQVVRRRGGGRRLVGVQVRQDGAQVPGQGLQLGGEQLQHGLESLAGLMCACRLLQSLGQIAQHMRAERRGRPFELMRLVFECGQIAPPQMLGQLVGIRTMLVDEATEQPQIERQITAQGLESLLQVKSWNRLQRLSVHKARWRGALRVSVRGAG